MKVSRTLQNCKVNCLILRFGQGTRKGMQRTGNKTASTQLTYLALEGKQLLMQPSLGSSLSSTVWHKNPLTSSRLFSTGWLVFHMAFLRIIFKNYSSHLDALPLIASIGRIFPPFCSSNHSVLKTKHPKELFAI